MPRSFALALGLTLAALTGCGGGFDVREDDFRPAARPEADADGVITYDTHQVAVARFGDTVADVAARIGMDADELATFNGRRAADSLRPDEVLALPRRVDPGDDIAALALGALDAAEADGAAPPAEARPGAEPVRHRVRRGETAYSIARLYDVSVRSLAEWNGLGSELEVREGQHLIIPIVTEADTTEPATAEPDTAAVEPGASVAPLPPSAASPLPEPVEEAALPAPAPAAAPEPEAPAPAPAPEAPAATVEAARFAWPVEGPVLRPFGDGNEGIDISAAAGAPVRAAADGEVAAITQNTDQIPILIIRHGDGLLTVYANVQDIAVDRGDRVGRGQTVAAVGQADPPFLHFEVRRGFDAIDPNDFLP